MLDSKLLVKSLAPVKKRLPTLADWWLKTDVGRERLMISMLTVLRKLRMSSRLEDVMGVHRAWLPSTMSSHSRRASDPSELRRWLKSAFIAPFSRSFPVGSSWTRRTSRPCIVRMSHVTSRESRSSWNQLDIRYLEDDERRGSSLRISPIPGPPKTLMSSLEEPPLSLMGMMLGNSESATLQVFPWVHLTSSTSIPVPTFQTHRPNYSQRCRQKRPQYGLFALDSC
jgi:hypothetical protein